MTYHVVPMRVEEHREVLLKLWKENFGDSHIAPVAAERFQWFYEQNPLGPALTWIAVETGSGAAIGCGSIFPWNKQVNGRTVRAGVASDFAVDRKHRVGGAALAIQRTLIACSPPAGFEFLVACPNNQAIGIFQRAGYMTIGDASYWVKPIGTEYKIFKYVQNHHIARMASAALDSVLAAADRWHLRGGSRAYTSQIMEAADERFDDLWNTAKSRYRIVGERCAAYLNWRYTDCKTRRYWYYCLVDRGDHHLVGYVVFSVEAGEIVIADLFVADPQTALLDHLLLGLAAWMRKEGRRSIVLTYFGHSSFERRLQRIGFFRRGRVRTICAYVDQSLPEEFRKTIDDQENWFLFDGEMDI